MKTEEKLPNEAGYYWAKGNRMNWFNIIVRVYGISPFFKVEGYDFCHNMQVKDISQIDSFGSRIMEDRLSEETSN